MKTLRSTLLALTLLPGLAAAAVPTTLAFSARIADAGTPITGSHAFIFTFWNVESGGVAGTNDVWSETKQLTVNDGVVAAALGSTTTLPLAAFDGSPLFLEASMDGTAFGPRVALHSVPYAFRAGVADEAAALASTTYGTWTQATFQDSGTINTTTNPVDWSKLKNVPAAIANGVVALSCTTQQALIAVPNGSVIPIDVPCPAGYVVTGGGHVYIGVVSIVGSYALSDTVWRVQVRNASGASADVTAQARCCKVN